jgi:Flp pilus assembly protein TadG
MSVDATAASPTRDRGAVDVSIEMLFGTMAVLMALLLVFETAAYWHARNVFDDAASDGARIAAAYDGSCAEGVEVARAAIARHAGSWARDVDVACVDAPLVVVTISGRTPGVVGAALGMSASVAESAPRER